MTKLKLHYLNILPGFMTSQLTLHLLEDSLNFIVAKLKMESLKFTTITLHIQLNLIGLFMPQGSPLIQNPLKIIQSSKEMGRINGFKIILD